MFRIRSILANPSSIPIGYLTGVFVSLGGQTYNQGLAALKNYSPDSQQTREEYIKNACSQDLEKKLVYAWGWLPMLTNKILSSAMTQILSIRYPVEGQSRKKKISDPPIPPFQ